MGQIIKIEKGSIDERRRQAALGMSLLVLMGKFTGINAMDISDEELEPLDQTMDVIVTNLAANGADILELEDAMNELKEKLTDVMKEIEEEMV